MTRADGFEPRGTEDEQQDGPPAAEPAAPQPVTFSGGITLPRIGAGNGA